MQAGMCHEADGFASLVRREGFAQTLQFADNDTQSAMDVRRPDALVLEYTRLMMAFLVFQGSPRHILMIGLGGGSLAKFCHSHLPDSVITVVEVDPQVIAVRQAFCVPDDSERLRVVQADGADYVSDAQANTFDAILVDGFDAQAMPASLGTTAFYDHCERLLRPGGVLVCNLHELDPCLGLYQARIDSSFGHRSLAVPTEEVGNCVVFACTQTPLAQRRPRRPVRPAGLSMQAWQDIEPQAAALLRQLREQDSLRHPPERLP